jgi:CubicO group peptidase (beta-lactamase class C family)
MRRLYSISLLIISLLLISTSACRKTGDTSVPTPAPDFVATDKILTDNLSLYKNNVVVLVSQDGKVVYERAYGLTTSTIRPIASASKWLAGAVIMSLVDEGKLSLADTVGRFLPQFTRYGKGGITIRQLFSHTSGFPGSSPQGFEDRRTLTLTACVDSIGRYTALIAKPGTSFNYGGVSMQVGGRVAEVVTGKSWATLFRERMTDLCQMPNTSYNPLTPDSPLVPGGAYSTARDYLNFVEMILNKGVFRGKRVLSEAAVQTLEADQTSGAAIAYTPYGSNLNSPFPTKPVRYGIGVWRDVVQPATGEAVELSSPGAFGTHPWRNRNQRLAGVIFTLSDYVTTQPASLLLREQLRLAIP